MKGILHELLQGEEMSKNLIGHQQITVRVMLVKLKGNPFNIFIIMVYAPTSDGTDEEIEEFYDTHDKAKTRCKSREIIIVMGDLNAIVEQDGDEAVVGQYGLGEKNDRGEKWTVCSKQPSNHHFLVRRVPTTPADLEKPNRTVQ